MQIKYCRYGRRNKEQEPNQAEKCRTHKFTFSVGIQKSILPLE